MSDFGENAFADSTEAKNSTKYSERVESGDLDEEEKTWNVSFSAPRSSKKESSSGSSETASSARSTSRTTLHKGKDLEAHLTPFNLKWTFGVGLSTSVINLTSKESTLIFYAASHVGVMYDYVAMEMRLLPGHKNIISTIAADDTGRWLVSADKGEDNTIIVWDKEQCVPVNTIFNPHPDCGTAVVGISGNAKYLVTIGNELKPTLNFWLWTYGNDQPDDSYKSESTYKSPVKIRFNPDVNEHMMVAFQRQILFFEWDTVNNKLLPPEIPAIKNMKTLGLITDCTYIQECHECVACTDQGNILKFGTTVYTHSLDEGQLTNKKVFVNAVKVSSVGINCIETVDGIFATGDTRGHIKFYDKGIKFLFWCQSFSIPPITSISFNLEQRVYKLKDALDFESDSLIDMPCNLENCECEDRSEEYEHLYAQLVPSDYTIQRLPFIIRDFIIATEDGRVASVDYMRNKCNFFFRKADAPIAAIDTHDEEPYLVIAYTNGVISLYNYNTRELLIQDTLPEELDEYSQKPSEITAIKYSPQCLHLACGRENGSLWFLDPIALTPRVSPPFRPSKARIIKLAFSLDSRYFAYYDVNYTLVLMKYSPSKDEWEVLGKLKSHYKDINDILFTPYLPSRLFSIGNDRFLVEYDLELSGFGEILLINRDRIEQTAIPLSFTYYPLNASTKDKYFLMSDNQFKFKAMHDVTYMCRSVILGPAYGCYKDSPIKKMALLPKHKDQYLIFANNNHIGIQAVPPDGNPYKYVGTIGHPIKLLDFCLCHEEKYIFTIGENDSCVLMWEINVSSVDVMTNLGGVELEPFYCLIEGGIHGYLFREMQDLFYYMQILHQGENTVLPRIVTDQIPVAELPDLMRACGFYPSEYEIENMVIDVKYRHFDETKTLKEEISFLDFVKLYINHRPAYGISTETLRDAFETFCLAGEGPGPSCITGESFVETLCVRGEVFSSNKAYTCLAILMREEEQEEDDLERDFSFLPDEINFPVFLEDILGMDMERQPMEDDKLNDSEKEEKFLC